MGTRTPEGDKNGNKAPTKWEQESQSGTRIKNTAGTRTPKLDKKGNKVGTRAPKWDKKGNKVGIRTPN